MTTEDLNALASFLATAPGKPRPTLIDPPHRQAGFRLSWHGKAGAVIATLTATPATGLCCIYVAPWKTCNHRRTGEVLRLLLKIWSFAEHAEAEMERLRGPELAIRLTEAEA